MCFSYEVSIAAWLIAWSMGALSFFVLRKYDTTVATFLLVWALAIGTMQLAEAMIWNYYPDKKGCLTAARAAYVLNILQPVFFLGFVMVFIPGTRKKLIAGVTLVAYIAVQLAEAGVVYPDTCTVLTEESKIAQKYWKENGPQDAYAYFVASTIAILLMPRILMIPVFVVFYGTFAISHLWYNDESLGSDWCLAAGLASVLLFGGYYYYFAVRK